MMKRKFFQIIIGVVFVAFIFSGCLPKPKPRTGDFSGKVIDFLTQEPVPGVTMKIGGVQMTTDEHGKFSIASLSPGDYQLVLERDWYHQSIQEVHHVEKQDALVFSIFPVPISGKILFCNNQERNWDIWELNLADRSTIRLSNLPSNEINPVPLPNRNLIFQSDRGGQKHDLYLSSYDNIINVQTPLACCTIKEDDEHPSVDKTGTKMVFKSLAKSRIVYNDDITNGQGVDVGVTGYNPVINLKGDRIAFASGDYEKLLIYDISGSGITKSSEYNLNSQMGLRLNNPCWSPDGKKLAFDAWTSGGAKNIYTIDVVDTENTTNGNVKQITYCYRKKDSHEHPCWSSDGQLIFFVGTILYSSRKDIYCIRVDDGLNLKENASWVMVTKDSGDKNYPTWSE
jgi:Tol biopolymer transport system component